MPSPIAHSVSGIATLYLFATDQTAERSAAWHRSRLWLFFWAIFWALAPDLDFIPQLLTGERYHHGFTHSLTFAIGVSLIVWFIAHLTRHLSWFGYQPGQIFWLTFTLYAGHLLLDVFTQGGPGIQLFWPLSDQYVKAVYAIFPETHHSTPLFQHPGHIIFILFELGYAAFLLGSIWLWNRRQSPTKKAQTGNLRSDRLERGSVGPALLEEKD